LRSEIELEKAQEQGGISLSKYWRFLVIIQLIVVLIVGLAGSPLAEGTALKIESLSSILLEPESGEVLFQNNADLKLPPASVTKLMVMLLVLEAVDKGQIKLTDTVTASPEACKMGGSQIWLEPGEQMTVTELLKAVCIVSANDASYALGEHLAGSEENFIALMNKRAAELGLKDTHYVNTTGLEPSLGETGNITSARDMACLAREVINHPTVFRWSGIWIDSLRGGKSFLRNTNNLVRFYQGCDGLKTGFTNQAGFCLVATAKRQGVRLVAVVMKAPNTQTRSRDVSKLFNYGFAQYKAYPIYRGGENLGKVTVFRGRQNYVQAIVPQELTAVLKRDFKGEIVRSVKLSPLVKAPVLKGAKIGEVLLSAGGKACGRVDLIADCTVPKASFFELCSQIFHHIIKVGVY
jgi:serine-type D-Ala-D-Ala carboxypeptidase (penicillin-binding protein 5/6)